MVPWLLDDARDVGLQALPQWQRDHRHRQANCDPENNRKFVKHSPVRFPLGYDGRDAKGLTTTSTVSCEAHAGIRSPTHEATDFRRTRDGDRKGGSWTAPTAYPVAREGRESPVDARGRPICVRVDGDGAAGAVGGTGGRRAAAGYENPLVPLARP